MTDAILTAIEQGMNIKRLLIATGLDKATFELYMDSNKFTSDEKRAIKDEIKNWEAGR